MSERPIRVGDLVMVVRPRLCCGRGKIGLPFIVGSIYEGPYNCGGYDDCGAVRFGRLARSGKEYHGFAVERLKRIPPQEELEGEQRREEIEA